MKFATATIFTAALLLRAGVAEARDPLVLQPSSVWQLDYGDDNCTLLRSFGEGKDATHFVMSMYAPDDDSPAIKVMRDEHLRSFGSLRVQFAPDTDFTKIETPLRANFGDKLEGVILALSLRPFAEVKELRALREKSRGYFEEPDWIAAERDERERAITEFRTQGVFKDDLRLELGSMSEPLKAMRTCLDELLGHWGIDAEVQRSLSRKALPATNYGDWIQTNDYPTGMLRSGYQGIVHFRLIVGADGKPTKCIVQEASNPDDFADVSCKALMRRARFVPALDAAGNPVASYWSNTVRFLIP